MPFLSIVRSTQPLAVLSCYARCMFIDISETVVQAVAGQRPKPIIFASTRACIPCSAQHRSGLPLSKLPYSFR